MADHSAHRAAARSLIEKHGSRNAARQLGIARSTLERVAAGLPVSPKTLEKIKPKVRSASEFQASALATHRAPRSRGVPNCWDLESIRSARDDQMRGKFARPAMMAKAMRTDGPLFVARRNRLSVLNAVATKLCSAPGARGEAVARKAAVSVIIPRTELKSIAGTLLDHNVAFAFVEREASCDGSRVDMRVKHWPIEHVEWREHDRHYWTRVEGAPSVRIVHGDGRWVVFRDEQTDPHASATILPACFVWAASAEGVQNWAASTKAHGRAPVVGELPEGVPLGNEDGTLSKDASAMLAMLEEVIEGNAPAGLRVAGAKTEVLYNGSTAWQVFKEFVDNREKIATRIYQGTDAMLGSVGGAPGVDISALFGVTSTLLQGDFSVIATGFRTGVFEPWTAVNYGDSALSPWLEFQLPDPDAEKKAFSRDSFRKALLATIEQYRKLGMVLTQAVVDDLAKELGVSPAPQLGAPPAPAAAPAAP